MPIVRTHKLLLMPVLVAALPQVGRADEAADLGRETRLETALHLALQRNPDLAEERSRVASARARADQAGRLPDLQFKYEQWGVPLKRPIALREANALMFGLSQTFPGPGTLGARSRITGEEIASAAASQEARRRDLRAQVRRAFADYYRTVRELRLHREHVDLTTRLVELARGSYRAGQRAQQDVLRIGLELARLHRDLAHIEQERISAQALLNALMNRPVEAPLGPPADLDAEALPALPAGEMRGPEAKRPELASAEAALRRSEGELDLARKEGRWPSLTIGADYMYMPLMEHPHAYGLMAMLNIPWLSLAKRDAIRAAEESVNAERHSLESVRNVLNFEIRDARARYDAARSTFRIVDKDLLPQAQRNFDAGYASYAAGRGDAIGLVDALRSYLDVRLDRVRALAHVASAAADLARATGEKESSK
jgi:cobalt-zinc-cadmium efflux system outer membrane protein